MREYIVLNNWNEHPERFGFLFRLEYLFIGIIIVSLG